MSKFYLIAAISLLGISLAGCTNEQADTGTEQEGVTKEQALEAAMKHANLSEADITVVRNERETLNGGVYYDVEFYTAKQEYDYKIDFETGKIASYDTNIEDFALPKEE